MKNLGKFSIDICNQVNNYCFNIQENLILTFENILDEEMAKCSKNESIDDLKFFTNIIKKRLMKIKKL